jgi:hypothetical protein
MPTLRRRNPRTGASHAPLRSSLADAAWQVEDRLLWGSADRLRGLGDAVSARTMYWGQPLRIAAVSAVGILLAAGVAVGIVRLAPSNDGGSRSVATVASAPAPAAGSTGSQPASVASPSGPVLRGSQPSFSQGGGGAAKSGGGKEAVISSNPGGPNHGAQAGAATSTSGSPTAAAQQSGTSGAHVAGPAAIAVARQFAGAFVLYETGRGSSTVIHTIFSKTATPGLTRALLKRPPRLPANVKVPEAKVLNIVPGPGQGGSYTLSISLLRVGVTSELKIEMQQAKDGSWQVTDVLG